MTAVVALLALGGLVVLARFARGRRAFFGSLLTLVTCVGTGLLFLVDAFFIGFGNCEDGCSPGSRWGTGGWTSVVELCFLAMPAAAFACSLVVAIAAGQRRASWFSWSLMTALLVAWFLYTSVSSVPLINFSGADSHGMRLGGLLVAGVGGLTGIVIAQAGPRRDAPASTSIDSW